MTTTETAHPVTATQATRATVTRLIAREYVALGLMLILFSLLLLAKINQTPYLFALDPWRDVYFTDYAEGQAFFGYTIKVYNGIIEAPYPSFLRSNAYLLTLITRLDAYPIFRYGAIFLRVVFALQIFALVETFTENRRVALLSVALLFTSPYFVRRSFIVFPENLGMLFHLLTVWSLEKYRRLNRREYLVTLGLALTGVVFVHSKSIYFSAFIVAAYAVPRLLDKDFRALRDMAVCGLGVALASLPVLAQMAAFVVETVVDNVGQNSEWGTVARERALYTPPTFLDYYGFIGPVVMALAILGLIYLAKRGVRQHLHLLLMFLLTFALSLGPRLRIYVPPDRMQAYLFVPLILIATLFVADFLVPRLRSREMQALAVGTLLLAFVTIAGATPWVGITEAQVAIAREVNLALDEAGDETPALNIIDDPSQVVYLLNGLDTVCMPEDVHEFRLGEDKANCDEVPYILTRTPQPIAGYELEKRATDYYLFRRLN